MPDDKDGNEVVAIHSDKSGVQAIKSNDVLAMLGKSYDLKQIKVLRQQPGLSSGPAEGLPNGL